MGIYYNPDKVSAVGKPVYAIQERQPHIPSGHRLIAVLDRGVHKIAPNVTNSDEFQHFYEQYAKGQYISMRLYLVPEGELIES